MKNITHQFMESLGPSNHVFTDGAVAAGTAAYASMLRHQGHRRPAPRWNRS